MMPYLLTDEEKLELEFLESRYEKLISETEQEMTKLRPNDPAPDPEEEAQLNAQRPVAPVKPENMTLEEYRNSSEYKAFKQKNDEIDAKLFAHWLKWMSAGSAEWVEASNKLKLLQEELYMARADLLQRAEDRHFNELGQDPEAILNDAYEQIEKMIFNRYEHYDRTRAEKTVSYPDVRIQANGDFRLDYETLRLDVSRQLERHFKELPVPMKKRLKDHISYFLSTSPFVSNSGALGAELKKKEKAEADTEKSLSVTRPKNYKRPNTKVTNLLFENELTTTDRNFFVPVGLNRQKTVTTYANFVMPKAAEALVDMYDDRVYAGVISCLLEGNNFIPLSMLYNRGVLCLAPEERGREITDSIEKDLLESISRFDGRITIDNDPTGELSKKDPNFKREIINEPLLFYQIRQEIVHGQTTLGIAIPSGYIPVGYRYAEANGNEFNTDPIGNLHVKGLNYSKENIIIENAIYKRIKEIQQDNSKKRYDHEIPENERTIRYDYIAAKLHKDYSQMTPTERNRLKKKIDLCLQSYQEHDMFNRYKHKRDKSKTFYAAVIYFEPVKKLPEAARKTSKSAD